MRLRSVELMVPQAAAASQFLEKLWGLVPVGASATKPAGTRFFRGTGDHPYILSITDAKAPGVAAITLAGAPDEIMQAKARASRARASVRSVAQFDVPGGGEGFIVQGPEGQIYQLIAETARPAPLQVRDKPIQITHAVINAVSREQSERFAVDVLGFKVSDRTKHMTFVRCNRKHHSLAFAHAELASLNHIAFEMEDIDAVMRGVGRMRDAGFEIVWGPGRHGPGNNVFSYFIAPFGAIIEYTAEVSEVDDNSKVGGPEDWKWPAGRIDQWGVSAKDVAKTSAAERAFSFLPYTSDS
jgi:catechol 2,3-dioxygenase-like lactoylglutathione lyase family enzyme